MKGKRLKEEQIIRILQEAESGFAVADLCRKHNGSEPSFYRWKAKYGGMEVSDARRLKDLERENAQLNKVVAEQALDIRMLQVPDHRRRVCLPGIGYPTWAKPDGNRCHARILDERFRGALGRTRTTKALTRSSRRPAWIDIGSARWRKTG